ncbi:MAG: N-terminal half of MaoC dehydratase [Actinomycetota bacterium]|nr:N-terminal half of MaoC dehydratase [Actinomycetota bacterium]MDQ1501256.1 N-terminal half of MaoC dehydratase [Actinomycetota bacterium]
MKVDGTKGYAFPAREILPEEVLSVSHFARVVGSPDRAFYSTEEARAAGYAARPLPRGLPLFFNAITEAELLETLGIIYGKTLAAGLEVEYGVVVTEQDPLVGQARVADAYERVGKDGTLRHFLVLETEYRNRQGDMVSRTRVTFIERAQ